MAMAEENNTETQDVNVLKTNIGELEKTIKTQEEQIQRTEKALSDVKKQLDEQIKENKRLQLLCQKAGINTTGETPESIGPNQPSISPDRPIVYRGQKRTKEWFDRMYERFSDNVAYADGKFYNIKEGLINQKIISEKSFEIGTFVKTPTDCKVYKLLGNGEVLITRPESQYSTTLSQRVLNGTNSSIPVSETHLHTIPELLFHVKGAIGNVVKGESFSSSKLICIGSYHYQDRKIQSFIIYEPLTKEQFAEALRSGFELVNYVEKQGKTVKIPIR